MCCVWSRCLQCRSNIRNIILENALRLDRIWDWRGSFGFGFGSTERHNSWSACTVQTWMDDGEKQSRFTNSDCFSLATALFHFVFLCVVLLLLLFTLVSFFSFFFCFSFSFIQLTVKTEIIICQPFEKQPKTEFRFVVITSEYGVELNAGHSSKRTKTYRFCCSKHTGFVELERWTTGWVCNLFCYIVHFWRFYENWTDQRQTNGFRAHILQLSAGQKRKRT